MEQEPEHVNTDDGKEFNPVINLEIVTSAGVISEKGP
jgi:hypothetical protein